MKKILVALLILAALPVLVWGGLVAGGIISPNSLAMIMNVVAGRSGAAIDEPAAQSLYRLPAGFSLTVFASDLPRARFLRFTERGDLLVSRPHAGDIVLLERDADGDGRADGRRTVIDGLNRPQGMDFIGDWLYIAERDQFGRIRFDHAGGAAVGAYEPLVTGLTGNGNHWSKTLRVGPDGQLYLAQGSSCNVCEEADPRRATMMRFRPDGSGGEIIATGLRNSVGFDWAPWNGGLYATDNGRDMLGDDFPPCELNRVEEGRFYGWPYFNGDNQPDPDMGPDPLAGERSPTPPVHGFRAHNAPLGIDFVDTSGWPGDFARVAPDRVTPDRVAPDRVAPDRVAPDRVAPDRVALVALHGSWNRSIPDGYKVVSLHFTDNGIEEREFLGGFNQDGEIIGRPVDVLQGPDGAVYVSDDYAAAIYRVSAGAPAPADGARALPRAKGLDQTPPAWLAGADLDAMQAAGETLYQQHNCRSCHEAGENPRPLENLHQRLGYTAVIDSLQAPQAPMPLFPLSEQQQRELAVYLLRRDQ